MNYSGKAQSKLKQLNKLFQPNMYDAIVTTDVWTYQADSRGTIDNIYNIALSDVDKGEIVLNVEVNRIDNSYFTKVDFIENFEGFKQQMEYILDNSEGDNFIIGFQNFRPIVNECVKGYGYNYAEGIEVNRKQLNSLYLYGLTMFYSDDVFNGIGSVINDIIDTMNESWNLKVNEVNVSNEDAVLMYYTYCIETENN